MANGIASAFPTTVATPGEFNPNPDRSRDLNANPPVNLTPPAPRPTTGELEYPNTGNTDAKPNFVEGGFCPVPGLDGDSKLELPPYLESGDSNTPWRGEPITTDRNWEHIKSRHIPGTGRTNVGDLFSPGTTRDEVEDVIEDIVKSGTRVSDPSQRYQVFEDRVVVNGKRDRVRVVVDTSNGTTVTAYPVRSE